MSSHINYGLIFCCSVKGSSLKRLYNECRIKHSVYCLYTSNYNLLKDVGLLPNDIHLKRYLLFLTDHKWYAKNEITTSQGMLTRQNVGVTLRYEHPTSNRLHNSLTYYGP